MAHFGPFARLALLLILTGGSVGSAPCFAQSLPAATVEESDEIIVTGSVLTPEQARQQAVSFMRGVGVAGGEHPVARWEDAICPRALGLEPAHAEIVEKKMRAIAKELDVPISERPECRTNIVISFVSDAGAVVSKIAGRSPKRLAEVPRHELAALREGRAPVRWWYTTDVRGRDGSATTSVPAPWMVGGAEGGGSALPDVGRSVQAYSSSAVSTQAKRVLTSATVVVDVNLAEGHTLDTVTAYAAMVAFAEIKGADYAPAGSILGAFENGGVRALTGWDAAFLRALYRLPLDRQARLQRNILVGELAATMRQPKRDDR